MTIALCYILGVIVFTYLFSKWFQDDDLDDIYWGRAVAAVLLWPIAVAAALVGWCIWSTNRRR